MEEQGSNQDEQRKGARTGWGHNADIAKELHVTRKFVYTVSVPLPSCNAYWCPAFHSTPMTRILKLYFLSTLKIHFYERTRRIARQHVVAKKLFRTERDNFFASSGKPETMSLLGNQLYFLFEVKILTIFRDPRRSRSGHISLAL